MAYELNPDVRGFLRSAFAARGLDEVLRAPAGALIGVHPAAEAALAALDISSVFDLAASHVFGAAAGLVAIGAGPDGGRGPAERGGRRCRSHAARRAGARAGGPADRHLARDRGDRGGLAGAGARCRNCA